MTIKSYLSLILTFSFLTFSNYAAEEVQFLKTNSASLQKHLLVEKSASNPIVSNLEFDKHKQMTVTIGFKGISGGYRHASVVFEYFDNDLDSYTYESVHLTADGDPDTCYGYGTKATVGKHKLEDILVKFVENYEDQIVEEDGKKVKKVIKKNKTEYTRSFSFICDKNKIDDVRDKTETDKRTVKFSFVGDLWNSNNYNCCSYASRVLGYCDINITFTGIKSDKNFEVALREYASRYPNKSKIW